MRKKIMMNKYESNIEKRKEMVSLYTAKIIGDNGADRIAGCNLPFIKSNLKHE